MRSGVSKYKGMRWMRRCDRMSGNPTITSMQLSITVALMLRITWSVRVTSLKRVKSKTTLPYTELFIVVPAKPTTDVGMCWEMTVTR